MSPRTGRPTDNPKGKSLHVRLDEKSVSILDAYTKQKHMSVSEAIRHGVEKLEDELKKEE